MKSKPVVYVNYDELKGTANRWFKGDQDKAWEAIKRKHEGRTVRLTRTGVAA